MTQLVAYDHPQPSQVVNRGCGGVEEGWLDDARREVDGVGGAVVVGVVFGRRHLPAAPVGGGGEAGEGAVGVEGAEEEEVGEVGERGEGDVVVRGGGGVGCTAHVVDDGGQLVQCARSRPFVQPGREGQLFLQRPLDGSDDAEDGVALLRGEALLHEVPPAQLAQHLHGALYTEAPPRGQLSLPMQDRTEKVKVRRLKGAGQVGGECVEYPPASVREEERDDVCARGDEGREAAKEGGDGDVERGREWGDLQPCEERLPGYVGCEQVEGGEVGRVVRCEWVAQLCGWGGDVGEEALDCDCALCVDGSAGGGEACQAPESGDVGGEVKGEVGVGVEGEGGQ